MEIHKIVMIRNNLRVPGSIRPSRVTFGALAGRRFFGPLETFSTKSS